MEIERPRGKSLKESESDEERKLSKLLLNDGKEEEDFIKDVSPNGSGKMKNNVMNHGGLSKEQNEQGDLELAMKLQKLEEEALQREMDAKKENSLKHSEVIKTKEWFFGKIDREEAEALLIECKEDSFLVRESSVVGNYAVSLFNFSKHIFTHTLITPVEYGQRYYQLQNSPRMYATVEELITKAPELHGYRAVRKRVLRSSSSNNVTLASLSNSSSFNSVNDAPGLASSGSNGSGAKEEIFGVVPGVRIGGESSVVLGVEETLKQAIKFLEDSSSTNIGKIKENLKLMIEDQENAILEFDKILVAKSFNAKEEVKLSEAENKQYLSHMETLTKLKEILQRVRLRGDEFRIIHKKEQKLFKINSEGQIMFCNIKRTTDPTELVPTDMSKFAYFNVGVLEGRGSSIYEITSTKTIHYIDEISKIVPDRQVAAALNGTTNKNPERGGGCIIFWRNEKKSSFLTAIPSEADELMEVVGSHLKKFKQSTVKQIHLLKDIWKCKSNAFDAMIPQHTGLLERLWKALKPDVPYAGPSGSQWKQLGFQGNNPATDFRGMGLLGLLNLIYFSETYGEKSRKLVELNRDYPFAVTGINLTSTLLNLLNLSEEQVNQPAPDKSWHTPLLTLFYYADNEDTFDELYCHSFLLFDKLWVHEKAGYMDFPVVIKRIKELLESLLQRKPLDVKQLIAWIDQLQVSFEASSTPNQSRAVSSSFSSSSSSSTSTNSSPSLSRRTQSMSQNKK